ncbi:30S ribosomal protein S4 [Candidatus Woesearchaeota archaeon]|nr:30S ribosomal protein S4 [Candidatus Woesearchaeota archaeon]
MGNIKKFRKKYQTPSHLWEKDRLPEEKELSKEYGLKNKREIWRMSSLLTKFKGLAKDTIASTTDQSVKESEQLLKKLKGLGLLGESSTLSEVLKLTNKDILERRLQTVVYRLGLARSVDQARQFITHGHIKVNGNTLSSPSYLVKKSEESNITFNPNSTLADGEHPERKPVELQKAEAKELAEAKKKAKKEAQKPAKSVEEAADASDAEDSSESSEEKKE